MALLLGDCLIFGWRGEHLVVQTDEGRVGEMLERLHSRFVLLLDPGVYNLIYLLGRY